jgi:Uma2 family endonuclease
MVVPATTKPITLDDLRAVDGLDEYKGMEIVDGQWTPKHRERGVSIGHGKIGVRLIMLFGEYLSKNPEIGELYMAQTLFVMHVDDEGVKTMREPDIAFVTAERVNRNWSDYYFQAPDLAVEVLSPSDTPEVIFGKLRDYFTYGTQQVWLVNHKQKKIVVHFPDGTAMTYGAGETVPGGNVLPGFTLDVARVFED